MRLRKLRRINRFRAFEPGFFVGKHRCQMLWSGSRGDLNLRFSAFWIKYSIECHVERKIWHNSAKSIFTKFEAPVCWSWSVSKPGLFCVLNKNNSICWSYKYHWGPVPIILLMDAGAFFRFEGSCFTRKKEIINVSLLSCWCLPWLSAWSPVPWQTTSRISRRQNPQRNRWWIFSRKQSRSSHRRYNPY